MTIGILAIQGSREEHAQMLDRIGVKWVYVRTINELKNVDALIMPGGESTHISMSITESGLFEAIQKRAKDGMPIFGTCAGAILLSKEILDEKKVIPLSLIDLSIDRNAYGTQLDSFATEVDIPVLSNQKIEAVFIRAPIVKRVGKNVEVLAEYDGSPILLKEGNVLISTFHPELTEDLTVHKYFLSIIHEAK